MTSKIATISQLTALAKEVAELDKKRTQGAWEYKVTREGDNAGGNPNDDLHEVIAPKQDEIICNNLAFYPKDVTPDNQRFIAKSPDMAAGLQFACAEIERLRKLLESLKKIADSRSMIVTIGGYSPINPDSYIAEECRDIAKKAITDYEQALNNNGEKNGN